MTCGSLWKPASAEKATYGTIPAPDIDMILGLPWTAWLLLFIAVGAGFGLSLAFYLARRG